MRRPAHAGDREAAESGCALRARLTDGDFPHVRRRGARLACCSCSTCCMTLLLGAIGAAGGIIVGIIGAVTSTVRLTREGKTHPFWVVVLFLLQVVVLGVVGMLIGGFLGYSYDSSH